MMLTTLKVNMEFVEEALEQRAAYLQRHHENRRTLIQDARRAAKHAGTVCFYLTAAQCKEASSELDYPTDGLDEMEVIPRAKALSHILWELQATAYFDLHDRPLFDDLRNAAEHADGIVGYLNHSLDVLFE
jgi:hypothetical protein